MMGLVCACSNKVMQPPKHAKNQTIAPHNDGREVDASMTSVQVKRFKQAKLPDRAF